MLNSTINYKHTKIQYKQISNVTTTVEENPL